MDAFIRRKAHFPFEFAKRNGLLAQAFCVDFYAANRFVINGVMAKAARLKIRIELAIDAYQ